MSALLLGCGDEAEDPQACATVKTFQQVSISTSLDSTVDLSSAQIETCFTALGAAVKSCARGPIAARGEPQQSLAALSPTNSFHVTAGQQPGGGITGGPGLEVLWNWAQFAPLNDGDRYEVTLTASSGAQLFTSSSVAQCIVYQSAHDNACDRGKMASIALPADAN